MQFMQLLHIKKPEKIQDFNMSEDSNPWPHDTGATL